MDDPHAFDRLFAEIADLSRIIHEMPIGIRRSELQARLAELKAEARRVAAPLPATRDALHREITWVRRRIAAIDGSKINVAASGGGSPGGDFGFTKDAMDLNAAIERGSGRAALVARLRDLEARLDAFSNEPPPMR